MDQAGKAQRFRELHEGDAPLVLPNPWDPGSAKIFARIGFPALATTSAGFAWSLGRLDGAVTRDEMLAHVRTIVDAVDLPVAADLENGYGDDPQAVAETIRLAASAGLVGASIEDYTGDGSRPIYPMTVAVERIEAAASAARALPFPFTLVARCENFLHDIEDLDDTIRRLQAYETAGADVLYAPLLPDADAIRRVCDAVSKPVNVLAAGYAAERSVAELAALGARRISLGSGFARVAYGALLNASSEVLHDGRFDSVVAAAPSREITAGFVGSLH